MLLDVRRLLARIKSPAITRDMPGGRDMAHAVATLDDGLGRDLIEALWIDGAMQNPAELYGDEPQPTGYNVRTHTYPRSVPPLRRAYDGVAAVVAEGFMAEGVAIRTPLRMRIAGAMICELAQQEPCPECRGNGWLRGADSPVCCPLCIGSRLARPAMSARADACRANRNDYRDRLAVPYQLTLVAVAEAERSAVEAIERALS